MPDNQFDGLSEVLTELDAEDETYDFDICGMLRSIQLTSNLTSSLYDEVRITLHADGTWNYEVDKSKRKAFFDLTRDSVYSLKDMDDEELTEICQYLGVKLP